MPKEQYNIVKAILKDNKNSKTIIKGDDFGAGSTNKSTNRTLSEIAKSTSISKRYGSILYNLLQFSNCKEILELGTSIGISSSYMALANGNSNITSIEGNKALAEVAINNHKQAKLSNINVLNSKFDEELAKLTTTNNQFDLIFFDGDHTKESTLRYFEKCLALTNENSIFVFDDIYWSKGMTEAWEEIIKHPQITLSLDLFRIGIVFFRNESIRKQHFQVWF